MIVKAHIQVWGAAWLCVVASVAADARIRCDGPYQLVAGQGPIRTPYCEDENLAEVAQGYGVGVSGQMVRASFGLKRRLCRQIGYDTRLTLTCAGLRNERRPWWLVP